MTNLTDNIEEHCPWATPGYRLEIDGFNAVFSVEREATPDQHSCYGGTFSGRDNSFRDNSSRDKSITLSLLPAGARCRETL